MFKLLKQTFRVNCSARVLSLVTSWSRAEHGPPRSGGVILGHVRRVVDGDSPDGRDLPAPGGLAPR